MHFVSYSSRDSVFVEALAKRLKAAGVELWVDKDNIRGGQIWPDELSKALAGCHGLIAVLTPDAVASKVVKKEITVALEDSKPVIPLVVESCEIPFLLRDVHHLKWQADPDRAFRELLAALRPTTGEAILPAFWNVPNANEYFTGREAVLATLEQLLDASGSTPLTQAVTGLGGIGKTQIAVRFCHTNKHRYANGVFWADASSAPSLKAAYGSFAVALGWSTQDAPVDESASAWLRQVAQMSKWLLVLDNADDPDAVDSLIPRRASGDLLITSRDQNPGWGRDPLPVGVLKPDEAVGFLLKRARRANEEKEPGEKLAQELGYLPLALEQAGAYLEQNRSTTFAEYLEGFRKQRIAYTEAKKGRRLRGDYEKTVATTWDLSFDQLPPASKDAIRTTAFLHPENIPLEVFKIHRLERRSWVVRLLDILRFWMKRPIDSVDTVIEPLTRYSFVEIDTLAKTVSVHRLVQAVILDRLEAEGCREEHFNALHRAMDGHLSQDPTDPASWPLFDRWFPHLGHAMAFWVSMETPTKTSLWNRAARYAWKAGRYNEARSFFQDDLDVRRRVLGDEHPDTLSSINNLASTLRALGEAQAARDLHQEALDVSRRVLGDEHPDTLVSINNLASTLRALGEAQAARDLHQEALDVSRRVLGDEHPDTLVSINNLASTLRALGEAQAARDLHQEALDVSRRVLGDEHPDTLVSINNLASTLRALGEAQAARDLHQEALDVRRRVLGDEHPSTLSSINNLASTLRALGEAQAARDLHQEALDVSRRVLGDEHPDTLSSINNLASTLWALGEAQAARDLHQEALDVRRRVLGDEHPDTLVSINNLASTLRALGEAQAARDLHQEALDVSRRVLGDEHPDTLSSINNLASTLWALGEAQAARDLHQEALDVRRRVLGDEHPSTLISINNLAETLRALGEAQAARDLHQEALDVSRRVLGDEHPDTLSSINNLASTLWALGEAQAARDLHQEALDVRRRVLGDEHPSTLVSIHNILGVMSEVEGMEVDSGLTEELLLGVGKLPEGMEIRRVAERRWGARPQEAEGSDE